ncbi:hypothetical protein MVEN_01035800 [Mycena venus]|uniref:Yeast cell wall synthesis Kre9/Knh1-like N-terminal domain-containing protein n=1 Tax=Mycena venus TaxID=2733690 RepID=A0A8H6YEE8_9AGAR|nr:hypothetical protein MVEN_01035800 [Mycena venus]
MFTSIVFTAVLASSSVLLAHADVTPNEPGPGEVFNQGAKCHVGWAGDTNSTTTWKNMAIELMTGSNEKMVHLTTVATGQDGTVNGVFDYDCPEVTPNSPIYFYQFTSGETSVIAWTTRFTIAAADGSTTPATQTEKASDGTTVGIGNGALVDPSTAVGPPTFNTSTGSSSGTNSASADPNSASNAPNAPSSTPSNNASQKPSGTAGQTSGSPKSSAPSNSNAAPSQSGSSAAVAVGPMVLDTRVWPFVVALTACASAFTILL